MAESLSRSGYCFLNVLRVPNFLPNAGVGAGCGFGIGWGFGGETNIP